MQQLSKTFAKLHGISSVLNLVSFASLVIHGSVSGGFCVPWFASFVYAAAAAAAAAAAIHATVSMIGVSCFR